MGLFDSGTERRQHHKDQVDSVTAGANTNMMYENQWEDMFMSFIFYRIKSISWAFWNKIHPIMFQKIKISISIINHTSTASKSEVVDVLI